MRREPRSADHPDMLVKAAVLAALAVAVLGGAEAHAAPPSYAAGWALIDDDAPVVGGRVTVTSAAGKNLGTATGHPARTSTEGTFSVTTRSWPSRYVITVRGGRVDGRPLRGTLRLLVADRETRLRDVGPVSTLVAARVASHGSLPRAQREVGRHLAIPRHLDLYAAERRGTGAFSGRVFLRDSRRHGGLDRFVAMTSRRIGQSARPHPYRPAARAAQLEAYRSISPRDLIKDLIDETGLKDRLKRRILSALGFGRDGPGIEDVVKRLDEIEKMLKQIGAQLTELNREVLALQAQVAKSQYSILHSNLGITWVGSDQDAIITDLQFLADEAQACGTARARQDQKGIDQHCATAIPGDADPTAWCTVTTARKTVIQATACDALLRVQTLVTGNDYANFQERVTGSGSADGVIDAYQKAAFAVARTRPSPLITRTHFENTRSIQQRYAWVTTLGGWYEALRAAAIGLPDEVVTSRLALTLKNVEAQEKTLPRPLPPASLIDLRTGLMWSLADSLAGPCGLPGRWLGLIPGQELDQPTGADRVDACRRAWDVARQGLHGLPGWRQPSQAELTALLSAREAVAPGEWLVRTGGLPDVSTDPALSRPIPPPDLSRQPESAGSYRIAANPGSGYGLGSGTCATSQYWKLGWTDPYSRPAKPLYMLGSFCAYLDLRTGAWRQQCVAGGGPWGFACRTPVNEQQTDPRYAMTGPLDWGHPLIFPLVRATAGNDGYYLAP